MTKENTLIEVKNLYVSYGNQVVLRDVNLKVSPGDYIGIIGPNGAGKSTLQKAILSLVRKDSGEISYSKDLKISYLPQLNVRPGQFPAKVSEVINSGFVGTKFSRNQRRKRIADTVKDLGLEKYTSKLIGSLSGGELQRVLLARSIVSSPNLLLLDEPTSALDPGIREQFYILLGEINKEKDTAILVISHDQDTICCHAKHIMDIDVSVKFFGNVHQFTQYRRGVIHEHN